MDKELKFFLEQGPQTVKDLARLTGKSDSTIRRALKEIDGLVEGKGANGTTYSLVLATQDAPGDTPEPSKVEAPKAKENVAPATPGKRGRKATASGQKLTAVSKENPRRKGSHGYRSIQIIIDNPGITTEDYVAKGGRLNDLRWDIAHGHVTAQ